MVLLPGLAVLLGAAALSDQVVSRPEGLLLIAAYAIYLGVVLRQRRVAEQRGIEIAREAREGPGLPPLPLLLVGLGMVYVGANVLVDGGVRILERTSLAAGFVGSALIGTLASLDEVLLEVLPVVRGTPELATGNLLGTVAAFPTAVLGLAALVRPLTIDASAGLALLAAAALYAVVAVAFLLRGEISRPAALLLLIVYVAWLVYTATL
jgi:cation:H+ antiporter